MWEDNRKLMTPIHSECLNYARENEYAQVRYAQGDWQTRDPELILYLEVPGKPPLVGVGLTERAVRFLRESGELDWEIRDGLSVDDQDLYTIVITTYIPPRQVGDGPWTPWYADYYHPAV